MKKPLPANYRAYYIFRLSKGLQGSWFVSHAIGILKHKTSILSDL